MKRSINEIYNTIVNYLIESFHMLKNKTKRKLKKVKNKFKKFYYYEVIGIVAVSVYFYKMVKKIYNSKYIVLIREFVKKYYKIIKIKTIEYFRAYKKYLNNAKKENFKKIKEYKDEYSKYMTRPILAKSFVILILTVFVIYDAYSWFYSEYQSRGTKISLGTVIHEVTHYDSSGKIIGEKGDTITVIEEDDLSNTFKNTQYIVIKNTGSLDLDYNLSFTLDGTMSNAGVLYYRVMDVTDEVNSQTVTSASTKLETYAKNNPTPEALETDAVNPVSNLTTIPQLIIKGQIDKDEDDDENNYRYYRIDYGMYQTVNSSLYSGASVAVHANVYSTQRGIDYSLSQEGQIWLVENETQFRDATLNALSGDTIKLADNIKIDGSIDFGRRVHLDTDIYNLEITGDLVYDFVEMGSLNINTSSGGKIDVGANLYVNTPKSKIHFIGTNKDYDIFVGSKFTVNGIQNEEEDGVLVEATRIIKNKVGNIPADMYIMSNTRVTIAPNVEIGYLIAEKNATNIEILNNGTITQIQLQDMNLIDTFSKYQIYVYNLNKILGVLGGSSIVLPENSTPFIGPNKGNTLIIKGVSSNDITVSGSDNFTDKDINIGAPDDSVFPIQGEEDSYYVYIRDNNETLEGLLTAYFTEIDQNTVDEKINNIKKLIIYTINSAYFENEDFSYVNNSLPNIEYLGLSNATVIDGKTINKIADNTLSNKTSLRTVILPKTLTTIGSGAFENVNLGRIYSNKAFEFLTIPSTVTSIGSNAFKNARYVTFEGQVPPTIGNGTFNTSVNGTKFFVPMGAIKTYTNIENINTENVYYEAKLSDNKQYFLYDYKDGYGVSYFINTVSIGDSLTIPNTLTLNSINKPITAIGYNAYRNLNTSSTGTSISIPTTVELIDSYAFYEDNITNINLDNVVTINDYAFYKNKLTILESDTISKIGSHAFYGVPLTKAMLENVLEVGPYAFYDNTTLYELNLGLVKVIGDYAFYNCPQLGRVWFKNTTTVVKNNSEEIDLTVGENSVFTNWGMYLDGRLRVYVPNGSSKDGLNYLDGYKKIFQENESFIYPTGTIIGSYKHVAIPYDFGEYSLRAVTKKNGAGEDVTAYEIIEYHGADLNSEYQLPDVIVTDEKLTASISGSSWQQGTGYRFGGTIKIKNNTTTEIKDWTLRINLPTGVTWGNCYGNANETVNGNIAVIKNKEYNGTIAANGEMNLSFYYDTSSQSLEANIASVYSSTSAVMNVISIGEYAYRHTNTLQGQTIDLVSNGLLNIDNHGLENISVKSLTSDSLISIGDYGLFNTALHTVNLPNLNSLGKYAMSDMDTLYSVNLGNIQVMKENSISNNPNLEQIFIGTTNTDNMSVHSTAMSNIGTNAKDRLRIYVPESKVEFYKALFSNYSEYIFETGYIVGSFINTPIPYDIGEYSVKEVTLKDRNGNDVNGWQIIEYHGEDITNTFKIPESYTANGVTKDVISIGDYAFKHTSVSENSTTDIVNNKLLKIGAHCFEEITAIKSFSSTSLIDLGSYAFNKSGIVYMDIENVKSIGSYAIANMTTTYKLKLGRVTNMEPNALYNLPNLLQTFFIPVTENRVFDKYAITDVGTQTSDRMRFYVASTEITETQTETKQIGISVTESCNETTSGSIFNRTYTNACTVTVSNNTDKTLNSWTTTVALNSHTLKSGSVSNAVYESNTSSLLFTNTNSNGTINPGGSITFTYTLTGRSSRKNNNYISNSTGTYTESKTVTYNDFLTEEYANSFRSEYYDYFFDYGTILGNYTSTNVPYDIGEYSVVLREYNTKSGEIKKGYEIVEYHGMNLTSSYIIPESLTINNETYPVIGIGKNAYRFATMATGNKLDISNTSLLYVNNHAFYKLAIRNLILQNTEYIGQYAFFENLLYKATLSNLNHIDNYAFANNTSLNYISLGPVSIIGEGAFYGCSNIEQMYFETTEVDNSSNSVKISIGSNAFYNTGTTIGKRLRIYVPDGNISNTSVTYQQAYKSTFPANIKDYIYPTGYIIGSYKYGALPYDIGEYSIREVTVKNALGTNVTGWEVIEYHGADITSTFSLTSPISKDGKNYDIVSIGTYAFYGVSVPSGQTWEFVLPNSVVEIGDYAFYKTDITKINGNQISRVGKYAFADCENLTNAIFNSVIVADDYSFYSCGKITYIQFGSGTTTIGQYALWNPYQGGPSTTLNMQVSAVPSTASNALPEYEVETFVGITIGYKSNFTYSVPNSISNTFSNTIPWQFHNNSPIYFSSDYLYIVDGNTAIITGYTGSGVLNSNLTIPDTVSGYKVTSIAANAFDNNTYVTAITLPASMNKLSDGFLDNNKNIANIYVDSANTSFKSINGILYDYNGTTLMRYPNGKTDTTFTVPSDVTTIAYRAFANNTTLINVTFNASLKIIGAYAFDGCTSITTYVFNNDVPSLTAYDTFDKDSLTNMYVPSTSLDNYKNDVYFKEYTSYLKSN